MSDAIILQRTALDCSICTIAMATGKSYDEVMAAGIATKAFDPAVGCRREYSILEALGLEQLRDFVLLHRGVLAPEFFIHFAWGRRAILAVPSLNIEGGFHSVYWTGRALRDPCLKRTYSDWSELRPDEAILFHERLPA